MREPYPRRWWTSLTLDLLPWALACSAFLWAYVQVFDRPSASLWPHIRIVATLWLALALLRLFVWRQTAPRPFIRRLLALACAVPLALLLLHYLLTLVGLSSWGRVPTSSLLRAYALQSGALMEALGYPLAVPIIAAILAFCLLFWYLTTLGSGDAWGRRLLDRSSPRLVPALLISLILLVALQSWRILAFPALTVDEPLALTFADAPSRQLQNHAAAGTAGDAAEDDARKAYAPATAFRRSNVILIIGDALRSDHLGLYGYVRPVTPNLDRLTKVHDARVSPRMRAACAESSCGLLALATSRYVHQLPTHPLTLHEVLRRNGYQVHMILGGDHTHFYGLREAYGKVDSYFDGRMQSMQYMNDDQLVLDHVSQMANADPLQPVLLQFHLMSSHGLGKRHDDSNRYQPSSNYYRHLSGLTAVSSELRTKATNYYDNGMIQLDGVISSLLSSLRAKGYLDDALVVLTGDHGEMLGEHGMLGHANTVHESVLDIPFLLIGFGRKIQPFAQRRLASQIDIAPTILHELGMPIPGTYRGQPLQLHDDRSYLFFQQDRMTGLYDMTSPDRLWKYWRDWRTGQEYVFDVARDPSESVNLKDHLPDALILDWRRNVAGSLSAAGSGNEAIDKP